MIATYVKDVVAELARFNPEARLVRELEIDGVSPMVACDICDAALGKTAAALKELERENLDLDTRNDELLFGLQKIKAATGADALAQIAKIITDLKI